MVYDGFVKGLSEHGVSLEDIQSWEYCGGNENSPSEKYFYDFEKKSLGTWHTLTLKINVFVVLKFHITVILRIKNHSN
jgi:hypothetical protein